jgi:uncharacterized protein YjbI with pentapeptide repeats
MRGIKPFKLSFISRPFSWGRSHHLGVAALAYFPLQNEPVLLTDQELWVEVPKVLGKDFGLDEGVPKSRSEFLIAATAYQPGGQPAPLRHVRATVGELTKSLYVVGDRFWRRGVPTEPLPFTSMPLTWSNAFGGEGYARNPVGKGFAPIKVDGAEVHPLPNIELPGAMIKSEKDRPDPAGFRPLDFTWQDRFKKAGTYDKKWLDTRFPGYAEDMDWRIWNAAPPDQWRESAWIGNERFVLEHMHPQKPRVEGQLPGISARCFVSQSTPAGDAFCEVGLKLTTIWLLPEIERGVLVFHGAHPIAEDDGADIITIMVAGERVGETPRPVEHYRDVMARRIGEEGVYEALKEHDLMPEGFHGLGSKIEETMELTTTKQLRLKRQRAVANRAIEEGRAKVAALGLDPDEHGPKLPDPDPPTPKLDEVPTILAQMEKYAAEQKEVMAREHAESMERLKALCEKTGISFEEMQDELKAGTYGPPTFTADGQRAKMRQLADEAYVQTGQRIDELEHYATDETIYQNWRKGEAQLREGYRMSAHFQPPAPALPASDERRAAVLTAVARGESLADWDLTGVDLSGANLAGADLTRAFLESTDLSSANLDGAQLSQAVLAHATLRSASLVGVDLTGANLGGADLTSARLNRSNLAHAVMARTNLTSADLSETNLEGVELDGAALRDARFAGANMHTVTFMGMDIAGVKLAGAVMTHATFMRVDASGLDFSGAILDDATFYQATGDGACFNDARMTRFRAMEASFIGARFVRADLEAASMRGVNLTKADLSGARLSMADLSGANLEEAVLYRIVARQSMWIRANLRRAQMISADLFESFLEKADLRSTDLRGANLYAANLALIQSDAETKVDEAIQDKVRVLPLRGAP